MRWRSCARPLGYDVQRDGEGDLAQATAVVIATHGGPEAETILAALDAGVGYVGLVASKVRGHAILEALELTEAQRRRVHTPVGLPIGAKTPAEIAVSIVAEVIRGIRVDGLVTRGAATRPSDSRAGSGRAHLAGWAHRNSCCR